MLSKIIAALLLLVSTTALAEPRKLATISNETPTAKQDAAVRHLNEVGRKYNDWLQSFTSTNEVISNAAEWDAAGQKVRFQTRGGAVIEADAKPVGILVGGRWAWPSQSSPHYSDATKQVRAWLDKNGMSFLTEQDSLDLNPSQIKSMLGLAAELTKQDGFYMIPGEKTWLGVVFSNPHLLAPQANPQAAPAVATSAVLEVAAPLARIKPFVGKSPIEVMESTEWKSAFVEATRGHYDELHERLVVAGPVEMQGDWLVGEGIMPHGGGFNEAVFAISADTGKVYGAMIMNGEDIAMVGFDVLKDAPTPIANWANDRIAQ